MSADAVAAVALIGATVATGLMAGLYFAFACAVMPGLARTDDRTFVTAMRAVNVRILNGWFALAFGGALVLTTASVVLRLAGHGSAGLPWLVAALLLYAATLVVTFGVNVPLNTRLAVSGDRAAGDRSIRAAFETTWVRWNVVRAVLATGALAGLVAAVLPGGGLSGS